MTATSGLKIFRIIKAKRPNWIVCENVYGHISMGLDTVLSDLEAESYSCQPFIVPACAVNAPHRRDRLWDCGLRQENNGRDGWTETIGREGRRISKSSNLVFGANLADQVKIRQQRQNGAG